MAKINDYDAFAEAYAAENESSLLNAWYERPAMLDLVGDPRHRRILDAGCGSGPLSAELRDRGAAIAGFDSSPAMVGLARRRLGEDADLRVADFSAPLPYDDGTFDDVVASLVLHYLPDWTAPLAELRRVLKPGGRLIVSLNHPILYKHLHPEADYFAVSQWSDEYTFGDQPAVLTYWYRPLHSMTDAFTAAGFRISVIGEPPMAPDTPSDLVPPELGSRRSFLSFIFFVLEAS